MTGSGKDDGKDDDAKKDAETKALLDWDAYKDKTPDEGVHAIYTYISGTATQLTGWYWHSIRTKRTTALVVRWLAFGLLIVGTAAQIYASTIESMSSRLHTTQGSLMLLAVAALLLTGDRVFGWSSGWTRYITTAMMMENLTREFQLKWAHYHFGRDQPLTREDALTLFELARALETQLLKAQSDETTTWATEFHAGLQMLESAIKLQRETTEKRLDELRSSVEKQTESDKKAKTTGSVEVALKFKAEVRPVRIAWRSEAPVEFFGSSWTHTAVPAGQHRLEVTLIADPPLTASRIVEVQAGAVTRTEIHLNG